MKKKTLRNLLLLCGSLLFAWFFCEVALRGWARISKKTPSEFSGRKKRIHALSSATLPSQLSDQNGGRRLGLEDKVIHPFFGFVKDPWRMERSMYPPVSVYGFSGEQASLFSKPKDTITVGVFGGSFALELYVHANRDIAEVLATVPAYKNKKIEIVNLSISGFKQPQQLMVLAYFLILGANFDIVINVDGFNEIVLPQVENIPNNIFSAYPRGWKSLTAALSRPAFLLKMGKLADGLSKRKNWAVFFKENHLSRSAVFCLVWRLGDNYFLRQVRYYESQLRQGKTQNKNYLVQGPVDLNVADKDVPVHLSDIWKRSSLQLNALCAQNKIRYYHFLQPNQYVKGAKPLTSDERKVAISDSLPYGKHVVKGYPVLRRMGKELVRMGVQFKDLTMILSGYQSAAYKDACCHLTPSGYQFVAKEIGRTIAHDLIKKP